jgi:excisionase family DNA binding protein
MNSNETLSVTINGQLTFSGAELERLLKAALPPVAAPAPQASATDWPKEASGLPRLAFSVNETAAMLGISYMTVYRLLNRGLLKCSSALRRKMISKKEIERFLKDTSKSAY